MAVDAVGEHSAEDDGRETVQWDSVTLHALAGFGFHLSAIYLFVYALHLTWFIYVLRMISCAVLFLKCMSYTLEPPLPSELP